MVLPGYSVGTGRPTLPAKAPGRPFPHLCHLTELRSLHSWLLEAAASVSRAGSTASCPSWPWPSASAVRSPLGLLLHGTLVMALRVPG